MATAFAHGPETCPSRIALPIARRPANALNIEIGAPMARCRLRTPAEWGEVDPRGARWLGSGGSPLVLGTCCAARCPAEVEGDTYLPGALPRAK